jgi:hypothetical protein
MSYFIQISINQSIHFIPVIFKKKKVILMDSYLFLF